MRRFGTAPSHEVHTHQKSSLRGRSGDQCASEVTATDKSPSASFQSLQSVAENMHAVLKPCVSQHSRNIPAPPP